jgi:hypothetical protein
MIEVKAPFGGIYLLLGMMNGFEEVGFGVNLVPF